MHKNLSRSIAQMTCQRAERIWPLGRLITPVSRERSLTKAPDTRMPLRDFIRCQPGPVHSGGHLSEIHSAVWPKERFSPAFGAHRATVVWVTTVMSSRRIDCAGVRKIAPWHKGTRLADRRFQNTTSLAITCTPNTCKGQRRRFFPQPLAGLITSVPLDG